MPAHDGQYGSGRGSDPGSFSAVIPQDWNFSGRIRVFDLAASDVGERRPDAIAKKGLPLVSLEETMETEEDAPRKELGADDARLAGSVDRMQLQRSIAALPPGYRMIFLLHDVEGYEHNEIAEMVGCSIGNSKSQLHKARMKLRDILKTSRAEKATKP